MNKLVAVAAAATLAALAFFGSVSQPNSVGGKKNFSSVEKRRAVAAATNAVPAFSIAPACAGDCDGAGVACDFNGECCSRQCDKSLPQKRGGSDFAGTCK